MKFIYLFLIIISCKTEETNLNKDIAIFGKFKSVSPNYFDNVKRIINGNIWLIGSELEIKKDSTFTIKSCKNFRSGFWKIKNDTLLLFEKDTISNDFQISIKPSFKYKISDKYLYSKASNGKGNYYIRKLKRIKLTK
jgi:hypothetical protein